MFVIPNHGVHLLEQCCMPCYVPPCVVTFLPNTVEHIEGIADSLCVGQKHEDDERVILFLKMAPGYRSACDRTIALQLNSYWSIRFSEEVVQKVKAEVRSQLTARHVPSIVLETKDIPVSDPAGVLCILDVHNAMLL